MASRTSRLTGRFEAIELRCGMQMLLDDAVHVWARRDVGNGGWMQATIGGEVATVAW